MSDRKWHQNPWTWCGCSCCLAVIVIPILLSVLGVGGAFWTLRKLGVHDQALELVTDNPAVVELLGEPLEAGWLMNGNVSLDNGGGSADYAIPIHGPLGDGDMTIEAYREDGEWIFERLYVVIDGERFDVVGGKAIDGSAAEGNALEGNASPDVENAGEGDSTSSFSESASDPSSTSSGEAVDGN